jgi:dsDNA-specific endonuclease/ATPase MutS2
MTKEDKAVDAVTAAARSAFYEMQRDLDSERTLNDRLRTYANDAFARAVKAEEAHRSLRERIAELEAAEARSKGSALRADLLQDALACQQEEIDRLRAALRAYQPGDGDTEEGPPPPCEDEFLWSPVNAKTKKIRKDKATPVDDEKPREFKVGDRVRVRKKGSSCIFWICEIEKIRDGEARLFYEEGSFWVPLCDLEHVEDGKKVTR